jgi:predicted nucleic acid-binding Zn ribbon protein
MKEIEQIMFNSTCPVCGCTMADDNKVCSFRCLEEEEKFNIKQRLGIK